VDEFGDERAERRHGGVCFVGRESMYCTLASNEARTSAVSTGVGSLSVAVRERVCSLFKPVSASLNRANRGVDL
jgi:hypothetical protein